MRAAASLFSFRSKFILPRRRINTFFCYSGGGGEGGRNECDSCIDIFRLREKLVHPPYKRATAVAIIIASSRETRFSAARCTPQFGIKGGAGTLPAGASYISAVMYSTGVAEKKFFLCSKMCQKRCVNLLFFFATAIPFCYCKSCKEVRRISPTQSLF